MGTTLIQRVGFNPRLIAAVETAIIARDRRMAEYRHLMRHEPSNNRRGSIVASMAGIGSVGATSVVAHKVRIRDSHDARAAEDRSSTRQPAVRHHLQDVSARGRDDGTCKTMKVPAWYLSMIEGLDRDTRTAALAPFSRRDFTPAIRETTRKRQTRQTRSQTLATRERGIIAALTDTRYRHDFNAS